ncbi:sigma-54 dependent transcriptional regulator [uncultured Mailhella sp.]|uniref:sigma-54-dependent transcriptional regulator n=1 Tax=uncultured Mailhella sp. TaxID=1981031 RepID=UPI0025DBFE8F|nr:sigma-54 dependent transcriptional regulator [uncultured Mailhella sp.]
MSENRKSGYQILVVDDDPEWHEILALLFSRKGWKTETALSGERALARLAAGGIDVVVCDLSMPGMSGLEVLRRVRAMNAQIPFIMMTGVGTIESAVEAVQLGAYSYLTKPVNNAELASLVQRAAEHARVHSQLQDRGGEKTPVSLIFNSPSMKQVLKTIGKVAGTSVPILITGETGTGKSRLAEYVHRASSLRDKPFLTIDCAALPESLLESELFGHVKGAFTGAVSTRRGLLEEAQGGTVFLDEIGELSPSTQAKLLRAIQEHEIRPVGSNKSVSINVRFIAATHRHLEEDVKTGRFREDLFYRLSVIPLYLPPLRERREDLAALIGFFISRFNERYGRNVTQISPAAMNILYSQPWKGNIRELENVLERAFLLTEGDRLMPESLGTMADGAVFASPVSGEAMSETPLSLSDAVRNAEIQALQQALSLCNGNKTQAAELLGIGRRTLYDKLEQFGLMDKKG